MRSTTEFAILAFVIYPILPAETTVEFAGLAILLEPQVIWLMVVAVAGIRIANYAIVSTYGGRGIAITGFFGGLASSTAVVGTMLDHVNQRPEASSYAVAAILLANAAMAAARNLAIAVGFTAGSGSEILLEAIVPLGAVIVLAFAIAALTADWVSPVRWNSRARFHCKTRSASGPSSSLSSCSARWRRRGSARWALRDRGRERFVSSAGATTSAVVLYRGGQLGAAEATIAILLATVSSIVVKALLAATSTNDGFRNRVAIYSTILLIGGALASVLVVV